MGVDRALTVQQHIAANVRRLRERLELTQAQYADATGLDVRFLQRLEAGDVDMSISTLVRLADGLGTKPGALLRETTFRPRPPGRPTRPKRSS